MIKQLKESTEGRKFISAESGLGDSGRAEMERDRQRHRVRETYTERQVDRWRETRRWREDGD